MMEHGINEALHLVMKWELLTRYEMDILTGLVADFHVLSKYCGTYEKNKSKL